MRNYASFDPFVVCGKHFVGLQLGGRLIRSLGLFNGSIDKSFGFCRFVNSKSSSRSLLLSVVVRTASGESTPSAGDHVVLRMHSGKLPLQPLNIRRELWAVVQDNDLGNQVNGGI